jgi:hypothetical protein
LTEAHQNVTGAASSGRWGAVEYTRDFPHEVRGAMGLFVAAYAVILVLHGAGLSQDMTDGLGLLAVWTSAGVCALAVARIRFQRWEVLLAAAAVTSYAVGLTYYGAILAGGGSVTFPSLADLINLLFYPLMLGALAVAVHRHVRGVAVSVWLDCALGSLGAAAVLAVVLRPCSTPPPRVLGPWPRQWRSLPRCSTSCWWPLSPGSLPCLDD